MSLAKTFIVTHLQKEKTVLAQILTKLTSPNSLVHAHVIILINQHLTDFAHSTRISYDINLKVHKIYYDSYLQRHKKNKVCTLFIVFNNERDFFLIHDAENTQDTDQEEQHSEKYRFT